MKMPAARSSTPGTVMPTVPARSWAQRLLITFSGSSYSVLLVGHIRL
jgi:hypothetical protein